MNDIEGFIKARLREAGIESAAFEARQLSSACKSEAEALDAVKRRCAGEPLQYILGEWEFYGLPFAVGKGVLIPRPDTEILVDTALKEIKRRKAAAGVTVNRCKAAAGTEGCGTKKIRLLDLCSGSGAIAVAISKNDDDTEVTAVEKSDEAFSWLIRNVELNRASVRCVKGDIFDDSLLTAAADDKLGRRRDLGSCLCSESVDNEQLDIILSNPPYIASSVIPTLQREVGFEPREALDGGSDGLVFYERIARFWAGRLSRGGMLAVEIGYDQSAAVTDIFYKAGLVDITCIKDYSGNPRVISGRTSGT